NFLNHYHLSVYDFYGKNKNRTFHRMLVEAGLQQDFYFELADLVTEGLPKLYNIHSKKLLEHSIHIVKYKGVLGAVDAEEKRLITNTVYYSFFKDEPQKEGYASIKSAIQTILQSEQMCQEIHDLLKHNYNTLKTMEIAHDFNFITPLTVHSVYSRDQLLA